ncbi:hypothetical protein KC332_g3041 [Hortaea werneckii]|nr:hypothetical protein KC358_g6201 [Hortaea werneckii]KAI6849607.1 hypothetical protein KC350_g2508 [Hortaea werneckii]KAI6939555.1 hypothetical protein KC341_g4077 [Hortaea werneckii]KAI6942366.1 hypothetical protein KC348_g4453 [Hortaea werneckii]KAI6975038.1 hypothetical protein KC321_g4784 [Hortaea werneckii]
MPSNDHVMDIATVKIGREVGGHKAKEQGRQLKHAQRMKVQQEKNEPIEVYSGSNYVAEMPLHVLTRFSKIAAGAFPRSKTDPNTTVTTTEDKDTKTSGKRMLILDHGSGVRPPTNAAVLICLDYMHNNKSVGREQILQAFHIPAEASILTLLNVYAAVLALGLRPFPNTLEKILCNYVTANKPTAEVLEYFYQRLPEGKLLTRTITSIVEKQIDEQYSIEENKALTDLIDRDDYLTRHKDGMGSVEAEATSQGASFAHLSSSSVDTAVHGKVKGHGREKAKAGCKGSKTKSKKSEPKESSTTPQPKTDHFEEAERRTEEVDRAGNGKGVNGKHVPGA